jgi:hypothetical protein
MSLNLKNELLKAFKPVKRTLKEYKYYIQDLETEKAKLKAMEDEKKEESDINRQKYSVEETEGAKKQTYKTLLKFIEPLKEIIAKIEADDTNDEEFLKQQAEVKDMTEYIEAKEHIKETNEIVESEGAANA